MDPLVENFEELKITSSTKTGLIFDEQMLLHSPAPKKHYENPVRLSSILSHLNAKSLLKNPNLDFIEHVNPALDTCIVACHPSNYIEYVAEMFPPECEKKSIFIFDSYYNKYTNLSARIAVSSINCCVDKVMKNEWKNAYALIRPPGHHSGTHTTINGFCIFNNVAIAVKYAQRIYNVKKILIFDWDIHHGDGTQSIFYKDPSVLFASIHRYENGSFYPNNGSSDKIGEGEGKGFNINLGWNAGEDEVANNEYIYAFERVCMPIFKEFNPELIFVSCGFDSCKGDPLGDIELTPDGYTYMLRRLQGLANGKVILALEGGYNMKCLTICSETVLRVLMNEEIPLVCSENKLNMGEMLRNCKPNQVALEAVDTVIKNIKEFWGEALAKVEGKQLEENAKIMNFLNFERNKKNCFVKGEKFFKKLNENEKEFYLKKEKNIEKFICKYDGIDKIEGVEYLKLENLFHGKWDGLSFLEVKLGQITSFSDENKEKMVKRDEKDEKSSSKNLGFRVSNARIMKKNQEITKIKKGESYLKMKKKDEIENLLKCFILNENGNELEQKEAGKYFIENLENLVICLKNNANEESLKSSSLLLLLNYEQKLWDLKVVDFKNYGKLEKDLKDENVIVGVENLCGIFKHFLG